MNGAKIATAIKTGSAPDCPWTTIPPQALTTSKPALPTMASPTMQYQYTYTDISSKMAECQSSSINKGIAGFTLTECVISTAVVSEAPSHPTATMEMGFSQVDEGTATTESALVTSISNALTNLCPIPTATAGPEVWTNCATGAITLGTAAGLDKKTPENGNVTIQVMHAEYNSTRQGDLCINMITSSANASASGANCQLFDWVKETNVERFVGPGGPPAVLHGKDTFCNMNNIFDTQFYDGIQETSQQWLEAEPATSIRISIRVFKEIEVTLISSSQFGFNLGEFGSFDCAKIVNNLGDVLALLLDAIAHEFAWIAAEGVILGNIACDAADTFHPSSRKRDPEREEADRLAKAWQKEMKKTKKLPMPEHKKRELGMIP
ncbi:hypothetical protein NHQ30_011188 [Ciborinia camelliae]|nr:hypothetical protein NHQ30_011188 [Ciborinia camelliae]